MRLIQLNTNDVGGGSEVIARNLHLGLAKFGIHSDLIVGNRSGTDPNVWELAPTNKKHEHAETQDSEKGIFRIKKIAAIAKRIANYEIYLDKFMGRESMNFPATSNLFNLVDKTPDLVHAHNLHGYYFDLRYLPILSNTVPVLITMHDHWLTTGHCALPIGCDRWKSGCGVCPDLTLYPSIYRDGTQKNLRLKSDIFSRSKLYLAVPSKHLADVIGQSVLAQAADKVRVVPNGIDLADFNPSRDEVSNIRERLELHPSAPILLAVANSIRGNKFKDYEMITRATSQIAEKFPNTTTIIVGSNKPNKDSERNIKFIPYTNNNKLLADYYRAADIFLHAAKKEVWGLTATEAMACGTPVVATGIEGLLEQIRGLKIDQETIGNAEIETATGVLVRPGDAETMARVCVHLLNNKQILDRLGQNAANHATQFSTENQIANYVAYYKDILQENAVRAS